MNFSKYTKSILQTTKKSVVGKSLDLRFDIIEFIKMKLNETEMTQKSLAVKMKMKDSQLTRIMRADSNITLETVARIYHAFGASPTIIERNDIVSTAITSEDNVSYLKPTPIGEQLSYSSVSSFN